jgi:Trk-type K+ transport system membrane component
MQERPSKPTAPKYADSSISDKAFKRMIIWFFIYCSLFCIGVIVTINADMGF